MLRRVLLVLGAGLVLNTTGCALLSILALPFELLFSFFGVIGDGLGSVADAVVRAESIEGPTPIVERVEHGAYLLRDVQPGARFEVVCSAPGFEERRFRWPEDLSGLVPPEGGRIELPCLLESEGHGG